MVSEKHPGKMLIFFLPGGCQWLAFMCVSAAPYTVGRATQRAKIRMEAIYSYITMNPLFP